jgi:phage gp29-like protein
MANLSAEALLAAETGLVKKVEEAQTFFTPPIREVFRLTALVSGDRGAADAARLGRVQWQEAESRSEAQLVDALMKLSSLGFPFDWVAERYGLSAADMDRVRAMRAAEGAERAAIAAASFGLEASMPVEAEQAS